MKNKFVYLIIGICFLSLVYSLYEINEWRVANKKNKEVQKESLELVEIKDDEFKIDFDKIKKENEDTVGYLKLKNTNIEYIVVKGKDNDYYLNHNFKKEYNVAGWIFADYRNKFDGEDKNITIYGHNMRDGSMFGSLKSVLDEKWYSDKDNLDIDFITDKDSNIYRVFSIYKIEKEEYYTKNVFKDKDEYGEFLDKISSRSEVKLDTKVSSDDKILTLSTCATNNKYRVVVHAVLVDNDKN